MNEINFFTDRIAEIRRELGISNAAGFLEQVQEQLSDFSNINALTIDLYRAENATLKVKNKIKEWCADTVVKTTVIAPSVFAARPINSILPAIAICSLDDEMLDDNSIPIYIASLYEQYKFVIIVSFLEDTVSTQPFISALSYRIKNKLIKISDIEEGKSLSKLIEETVTSAQIPTLKTLGNLNQVKPALLLVNQILQTENKVIQTRKLLSTQNQLITRKDEQSINNMELGNNLRQGIQKFNNDMDKSFRSKYDELNKPVTGAFTKHIAYLAEQLSDFERSSIAEKDEREEIKLKDDYQEMVLGSIKKTVSNEMKKDSEFLTTSVNELMNRINAQLSTKNIPNIRVDMDVISFPTINNSIIPFNQFNRPYKSELIKKGLMEYFVALRDYTGIIMVATGLFAPLTIIANISENGFLKHLSNGIKFAMAGIAIFLIVYGIFDLRKRIPLKRKEEFLKEIEKGKEYVINEGKRMTNEISRDWVTASGNWVKEVSQAISNAFEKKLKDTQQSKVSEISQDKSQQLRRQQNLDAQQRNIANAERIKDAVNNRLRDMYMEADKKIFTI